VAEPLGHEAMIAAGWRYVDPPSRFSPEMWLHFLSVIGDGEFHILVQSNGVNRNGERWARGQLLISPKGWENMANRTSAKLAPSAIPEARDE
jgi:hypothetical protein